MPDPARRSAYQVVSGVLVVVAVVYGAGKPLGGTFRPGPLLDPVGGLWRTARNADAPPRSVIPIPALENPVEVGWDARGVPHVFAANDLDAVRATGYVVARDRLFQMDFLRRFTAGRLSGVFGPGALPTDRRMRSTGIARAVRMNVEAARQENRPTYALFAAFAEGVNAYLAQLDDEDLPFEFRLFDYRPEPFTVFDPGLVGWNLIYDLSWRSEPRIDALAVDSLLGPGAADLLYPRNNALSRPIVPPEERHWIPARASGTGSSDLAFAGQALAFPGEFADWAAGYTEGKGSNNWAVGPARSTTGAPILAGDMHLALWLPSIWYELHVVTPEMDSYGVTVPGVPLPIEAFNPSLGWAFTNTPADQMDHLVIEVDSAGRRYRYEGTWIDLQFDIDTLRVRGTGDVVDTVRWTHWGPVVRRGGRDLAMRWVGHDTVRTFDALYAMNRSRSVGQFQEATRLWDAPMQNILVADAEGSIAIRSTGHLPVRADAGGAGFRDGSSAASEWTGRVPFDDLPHARDPVRGYLTSTNQQPTDDTYPWYVSRDWESTTRSIRIDTLLQSRIRHGPEAIASYQADVRAVQRDWFVPLLPPVEGLSESADSLRRMLMGWAGDFAVDRPEPLAFDVFLGILSDLVWDEPAFGVLRPPSTEALYRLLSGRIRGPWLDRTATERIESEGDVLAAALEQAADSLRRSYGSDPSAWAWGLHHRLLLRHVTGTPALATLWRGPLPYPGTDGTLSPAAGRTVTFSASWRVVVDFAGDRTSGRGIYAGGPSGNPFSRRYDQYVDDYVGFRLRDLPTPARPDGLPVRSRLVPDLPTDSPSP